MKNFDYDFDFGFSAVDEKDIKNNLDLDSEVEMWETRARQEREAKRVLFSMIMPLLKNLRKNPDSEYIHWKNRDSKIQEFGNKLSEIALDNEEWK
jgi:hypothetical protein